MANDSKQETKQPDTNKLKELQQAAQAERDKAASSYPSVAVVLNPDTGLGGYTAPDGRSFQAGGIEADYVTEAEYDEYSKLKVRRGGTLHQIIVKA